MGAVIGVTPDRLGPEEFARLFQQHWRVLWCAAVGVIGDRTLAQDVVQQAAVVALERLDQFAPDTSFVAWMMQIVRNIALNEGRKRGRRRTGSADTAALDAASSRPVGPQTHGHITGRGQVTAGVEPFDDELLAALQGLDETARGCLLMRVVLDMPYKQIALALDIPEGTAASHVHRARASLRQTLRPATRRQGRVA
jgi:RNA polymerase sigma-70 factor (ECF subfamily)